MPDARLIAELKQEINTLKTTTQKHKTYERAIESIVSGVSSQLGESFMPAMVKELSRVLRADITIIGETMDEACSRIRSLSFWDDGQIQTNIEYDLEGSPCETVVGKDICAYPKDVARLFPQDKFLKKRKLQGYVGMPLFDAQGRALGIIAALYKKPIEDVQTTEGILRLFAARTAAEIERVRNENTLKQQERELEKKTNHLMEANQALRAALDHREAEKRSIEETILDGVRNNIFPYLDMLRDSNLDPDFRTGIDILKSNLNDLARPYENSLYSKYQDLTPKEIMVADLIRHGKSSKEISASLNISTSSISFYRYNIRKKMGLINKKVNLRTQLVSVSD